MPDDDFEQFDNDATPLTNDAYRTRKPKIVQAVVAPKIMSDAELRRAINVRAITYLSRREYSRAELHAKLTDSFDEAHHLIEQVLDELSRNNWQSDERYAAQLSKVKGERFGVARLKHEFKQKGLDDELVQQELAQLKQTEYDRAREVWRNKFGSPPIDLKDKARQVRFMASRGFDYDTVRRIIKNIDEHE